MGPARVKLASLARSVAAKEIRQWLDLERDVGTRQNVQWRSFVLLHATHILICLVC